MGQDRAAAALQAGRFAPSIVPVKDKEGTIVLDHGEYPRPGTTVESLAALQPSFEALGAYRPYNGESFDETALRVYPQVGTIQHVPGARHDLHGLIHARPAVVAAQPVASVLVFVVD